ncbi:MAG: hypothetical protein ACKVQB_12655 [Bacteroidia bacterium]
MNKYFYLLFFSVFTFSANAQTVFQRKFEAKQALLFDITLKQQYPGGDLIKRFGKDASLGVDLNYKTTSNWVFGIGGHFIFGNIVKERGVLDSMKGSTGEIIDENGQFSVVGLDQRGMYFGASVGRIISFGGINKNSGLFISLGGGYLQHKIRIYSTNTVPQLTDEYKKGYDRLTFGPAATQYIGYRFLDPKKRINFSLGVEFTQGFTQNRRSFNFDTRMADNEKRLDLLTGLKFTITVPIYLKKANEEEFFE